MQTFLAGIKEKLPALIDKANSLKPLFINGDKVQTNQEIENNEVNDKIGDAAAAEESPMKKYIMYAVVGVVVFMLLKKKKML